MWRPDIDLECKNLIGSDAGLAQGYSGEPDQESAAVRVTMGFKLALNSKGGFCLVMMVVGEEGVTDE